MTETGYHMSAEEFRKQARQLIDWIVDYHERRVVDLPVLSRVDPGAIRRELPEHAPEQGESFEAMMRDVDEIILPGITHWQSPNFYAYFPANVSYPSILGELLSAGLGVQGMLWSTSPACTELETHVLDWTAELLGLPEPFMSRGSGGGVIQDSASSAALTALLAARERATEYRSNVQGLVEHPHLIAYASTQTHSSVEKDARVIGIGRSHLRAIEVDEDYGMRPDLLEQQIGEDLANGLKPFFVCATVGTTSSNAMDPLRAIGRICREHGIWLHVDAAMSGTAAICPEFRFLLDGVELADSFAFNPHKWMFTNFDCDCFFVSDRAALIRTLSILPEYLRNRATEAGAVIDYRDWHVPLGRRFRALKLWFVLRHYGAEGLRHHIRRHIALAQAFASWVEADERFELVAPVPLNLVCFRLHGGDRKNEILLDRINQDGRLMMSHTRLNGQYVLRFCVGQTHTEERHVAEAWRVIRDVTAEIPDVVS